MVCKKIGHVNCLKGGEEGDGVYEREWVEEKMDRRKKVRREVEDFEFMDSFDELEEVNLEK